MLFQDKLNQVRDELHIMNIYIGAEVPFFKCYIDDLGNAAKYAFPKYKESIAE